MSRLVAISALPQDFELGATKVKVSPLVLEQLAKVQAQLELVSPGTEWASEKGMRLIHDDPALQELVISLSLEPNHPEIKEDPGLARELREVTLPIQFAKLAEIAFRTTVFATKSKPKIQAEP